MKKSGEEVLGLNYQNPYSFNQGDVDMEQFFRPLLIKAGGKLDTEDAGLIEELRRLDHLHFLTIFGARIWTAIHTKNWRHREAAA